MQRGEAQDAPSFFVKADYRFYLACLSEAANKCYCQLHAYVLMTNPVHLLVTPRIEYGLSQMMQSVGRRYVRYINHSYRRTGTLWEGRYKVSLVESDRYLLTCSRYIELNPVRANMVITPSADPWSSYRHNAFGKPDKCLTPHPLYLVLGTDTATRQHAYRELFHDPVDHALIHEIRDALNQELVLGSEYFKDRIERTLHRRARPGQSGRPRVEEESPVY